MKTFFCSMLTLMIMLPLGLMAQSPVGNWKMSIPDEKGNMIPLKVDISADGTYSLDFGADGVIDGRGNYTLEGGKMTVQDTEGSDCKEKGVYALKIEGDMLTMTRESDGCANRGGPDGVMTMQKN